MNFFKHIIAREAGPVEIDPGATVNGSDRLESGALCNAEHEQQGALWLEDDLEFETDEGAGTGHTGELAVTTEAADEPALSQQTAMDPAIDEEGGMDTGAETSPDSVEENASTWEMYLESEPDLPPEEDQTTAEDRGAMLDANVLTALQTLEARAPTDPDGSPPAGRAKTRLLGFHRAAVVPADVFAQDCEDTMEQPLGLPVGWLVVVEGPGRGACFTLRTGVSTIGRGADQSVCLDLGDDWISRDNHAAVAYDEEQNDFFVGHGGKTNVVRLNGQPILTTEKLSHGDLIRIGKTTLRFVPLCNLEFAWDLTDEWEAKVG